MSLARKISTIAVTGASGALGGAIVRALRARPGVQPIAAARTPAKAAGLKVPTRPGDYDDLEQLVAAFADVHVVVLVAANTPPDVRLLQHQRVVAAAVKAGVRKITYAGIPIDDGSSGFGPIQRVSRATEVCLEQSGLAWSVGRCGIYIEPDLEDLEHYRAAGTIKNCAAEGRCAYTSRPETAQAFAQLATQPAHDGQIHQVGGRPVSQAQLAAAMNEVFGTSLTYTPLSVEDYRADRTAALGPFLGKVIAGIYESIRHGGMDMPSDFERIVGRPHAGLTEMMRRWSHNNAEVVR